MEGFLVFLFLVFLVDNDGNFFLLLIVIRGLGADGRFCPNIVSDNLPLRPGDPYHIVVLPSSLSSSSSSGDPYSLPHCIAVIIVIIISFLFQHCLI